MLSGSNTPSLRPELTVIVAEAIAVASEVETSLGETLGKILGADDTAALSMYEALVGPQKNNALRAAARVVLNEDELHMLEAVLSIAKSAYSDRHRFAHWIWAIALDIPDALLFVDPAARRTLDFSFDRWLSDKKPTPAEAAKDLRVHFDGVLVYRKVDLQESVERLNLARHIVGLFHNMCSGKGAKKDEARNQLMAEQSFNEALQKIRNRKHP